MRCVKRSLQIFLSLYVLYLAKTAMGINISDRYTAPTFVKFPVKAFISNH
ncbi:MAG: hypothetical protein H7126_09525 [Candidatus Parcubacteria bacterium]|nr:hypothetical protein [Leptolyngbyaceae cyanobacterium LF-bin-113]